MRYNNLFKNLAFAMLLSVGSAGFCGLAQAQTERIVAVVNDDPITSYALETRLALAQAAVNLPDNDETRKRLLPQVLNSLIDEKLQTQEAKKNEINVADSEVAAAFAAIAQQNGLSIDDFMQILNQRGVSRSVLEDQLRSQLMWSKLVQRRVRPNVVVGDDEINDAMQQAERAAGTPEYLVAEIFLSVDNPQRKNEVKEFADRLVSQIRSGSNFPAMARQFSQSVDAANGGDLGWVRSGQLNRDVETALVAMRPGQVSPPVESEDGWHILLLRDSRMGANAGGGDTKLKIKQIFLPYPVGVTQENREEVFNLASDIRKRLTSCAAMDETVKMVNTPMSGDIGTMSQKSLPPVIADAVSVLPIGQPSIPLTNDKGVLVLMVCDRQMDNASAPARDAVAGQIGLRRLDMLARRYLRDLRDSASVDVRIK